MGTPRAVIGFITTIARFSRCALIALRPPMPGLYLLAAGAVSTLAASDRGIALGMISRTFDGRTQLLEYAPTVLSGPPAADRVVER
jgi:hypothetical protein